MYLKSFTIQNIKCFESLTLDFQEEKGPRLWNVIIGENGTGKSTLLQAMAIALMGEQAASVLLPRPYGWVRDGNLAAEIHATMEITTLEPETAWENTPKAARMGKPINASYQITITGERPEPSEGLMDDDGPTLRVQEVPGEDSERLHDFQVLRPNNTSGWFAVGYGPFRRLSGGSEQGNKLTRGRGREARFVTLFREDVALIDGERWLMELDYARLDPSEPERQEQSKTILGLVQEALNSLLPSGVQLGTINSQGVFFHTPYSDKVRLGHLSDGYRAMLALGLDLLRSLSQSYKNLLDHAPRHWLSEASGIVLIDELDAHLHPIWQREVGYWLKERFPKLQFIVATHSPFIPQAADEGGIYVLRRPDPAATSVQVYQDEPSVQGWRADQILSVFFEPEMYYPEAERSLDEYAHLKMQRDRGQPLSESQVARLAELQSWVQRYVPPLGYTAQEIKEYREEAEQARKLSKILEEKQRND